MEFEIDDIHFNGDINLSNNTIKNIKAYEKHSIYISNAVLFFVAFYILTKIFYN